MVTRKQIWDKLDEWEGKPKGSSYKALIKEIQSDQRLELSSMNIARTSCELCGAKLRKPETDYRNIAICKKCLKGQLTK